jgi:hypothetical protein
VPPEDLPNLRLLLPDQDWQRRESVRALVYSLPGRAAEVVEFSRTLNFSVKVRFPSPAPLLVWVNEIMGISYF